MTWTTHNAGVLADSDMDASDVSAGDAKLDDGNGRSEFRPGSLAYSASSLSAAVNSASIHHEGVLRSQPSKQS